MRSWRLGHGRGAVEAGELSFLGREREECGFLRLQPAPRLAGVGRQLSADEGQEARLDTYRHEHMLVVAKVVEEHSVEYRSSSPGGVRARGGGGRAGGAAGLTGDDQKVGYS